MSKFWYFLSTFAESGLSVFGIRSPYEQPSYTVVQQISPVVEIRRYAPRVAVETPMTAGNEGEAFGRLFRYITGANGPHELVAMTAPVAESSRMIAMTVPVSVSGMTMQFFLPQSVVAAGVPQPTDPKVHVVKLEAMTFGVIRYSGLATEEARAAQTVRLKAALAQAGKTAEGPAVYLSYDPPFAIPFLRRNEVAIPVS